MREGKALYMQILFATKVSTVNISLQLVGSADPKTLKIPTIRGKLFSAGEDKSRYSAKKKIPI